MAQQTQMGQNENNQRFYLPNWLAHFVIVGLIAGIAGWMIHVDRDLTELRRWQIDSEAEAQQERDRQATLEWQRRAACMWAKNDAQACGIIP